MLTFLDPIPKIYTSKDGFGEAHKIVEIHFWIYKRDKS